VIMMNVTRRLVLVSREGSKASVKQGHGMGEMCDMTEPGVSLLFLSG